jgi:spore maturation protein B
MTAVEFLRNISSYALPVVVLIIISIGFCKGGEIYDTFLEGADEGIQVTIRIIPPLVGLITAVGVFRASGALDLFIGVLSPIVEAVGLPAGALPLALLRPVSGSASLALLSELIACYGPDSYTGRVVSTMMGSTETIFYTITVYYGSVGIKKIRYTLAAALIADLVSILASSWACRLIFGA